MSSHAAEMSPSARRRARRRRRSHFVAGDTEAMNTNTTTTTRTRTTQSGIENPPPIVTPAPVAANAGSRAIRSWRVGLSNASPPPSVSTRFPVGISDAYAAGENPSASSNWLSSDGVALVDRGVGSNAIQPCVGIHISTHEWAFLSAIRTVSSLTSVPPVKPRTTREGSPTALAMSAIVVANCSQ